MNMLLVKLMMLMSPFSGLAAAHKLPVFFVAHATSTNQQVITVSTEATTTPQTTIAQSTTTPQFVIFSFDGSKSESMWQGTRSFAKSLTEMGKPLKFTYFISGVYLLDPEHSHLYQGPYVKKGVSAIGFGTSKQDVEERVKEINAAFVEGNEIGSHANGHFNGSKWTEKDWDRELAQFSDFLFNAPKNNEFSSSTIVEVPPVLLQGFRAPELGYDDALYPALARAGYHYDVSSVDSGEMWPHKDQFGIWHFPLSNLKLPQKRWTISMDYSLYALQTAEHDSAVKGSPLWDNLFTQVYSAYTEKFNDHYNGNRAPIFMANHFSLWNDGVYWEVMKKVAEDVCGKPDVRCGTYSDLASYLDSRTPEQLSDLQKKTP